MLRHLLSKQRIRPPQVGQTQNFFLDMTAHMDSVTGAGRFALGAMFGLMNALFSHNPKLQLGRKVR